MRVKREKSVEFDKTDLKPDIKQLQPKPQKSKLKKRGSVIDVPQATKTAESQKLRLDLIRSV